MKDTGTRKQMMLYAPVEKVIPRLAVPTIITMLITSIYNMADTYFVSQINTSASGAVGVIFSAMSFIQAIAFTFGMGSGTNVSQALGAGDEDRAKQFASTGFFTAFATGILIAVLGLTNIDRLVVFLGATETIAPYARDYATFIFYATPFIMCSFLMNNLLRFQGLAAYGMIGITSGGILNMILDPIFIFGLELGTAGAAIATALSQFISFCILLFMTQTRKEAISIHPRNYRFDPKIHLKIWNNGLPSLTRQGIASIASIVLNNVAGPYGDAAIAALSISNRFVLFINSTVIGFGQGFQPLCGFCYGAKRYDRVKKAFWFCSKVATVILVILSAVAFIFSEQIITLFRRDDLEVIRIGTLALRLQLLTMPLWGFVTMSNMLSQSIGYGIRASILASARQGLFLIPILLILPEHLGLGLFGLQVARPLGDLFTLVLCIAIIAGILKKLDRLASTAEDPQHP